jgi:signal transduction histidine kinase
MTKIENPNSDFFGKVFESQDEMKRMFENIYGDSGRYMQCLLNFLSNAIKFSQPEKTIIIRLTLLEAH